MQSLTDTTDVDESPEPGGQATRRFALICTLFLLTAVWLEPHLEPLNRATAIMSAKILAAAGFAPSVAGDLITVGTFPVRIVTECTSLYATLLFVAFILVWPATWTERLTGIVAGGGVIGVVNLLRIAVVTVIGTRDPVRFEIIHVYLGQVTMLLLVIGCCLAWRHWCSGERGALAFMFRAVCWGTILFLPWLMVHKVYLALVDALVRLVFSLLFPQHAVTTPLPLAIYNHPFSVPLLLALLLASSGISRRRAIVGGVAGVLLLTAGYGLFRVTHVIWTAFDVPEILPIHQLVYLAGQFLLPVLLWLLVAGRFQVIDGKLSKQAVSAASGMPACLLLIILLSWPLEAEAQSSLVIQPGGDGVYHLRAYGLNGMTGGEFSIGYQSEEDDRPRVTGIGLGAGSALQVDDGSGGNITIRLNSSRPLRGTGLLASIQLSGRIIYLSALLQNERGGTEHPTTRIEVPPEGAKKRQRPVKLERAGKKSVDGDASTVSAEIPPDRSAGSEPLTISVTVPSDQVAESGPTAAGAFKSFDNASDPVTFALRRVPSVLERMLAYDGERAPEALLHLFMPVAGQEFRQEPPVQIADGQAEVSVRIRLEEPGDEVRCFLIRGAHFVSLQKGDDGEWLLYLVPERGALAASVTVQTQKTLVEYPLTVAPPLSLFNPAESRDEDRIIAAYVTLANERAGQQVRN